MANRGYRSIEVMVFNKSLADLTVRGALPGGDSTWIDGEVATEGDQLSMLSGVRWGVMTKDQTADCNAQVTLYGRGSASISMSIDADGNVSVTATTDHTKLSSSVSKNSSSQENHQVYEVDLTDA